MIGTATSSNPTATSVFAPCKAAAPATRTTGHRELIGEAVGSPKTR